MLPSQMSSDGRRTQQKVPLLFVPPLAPGTSTRQLNLERSFQRSHAATVAHTRRQRTQQRESATPSTDFRIHNSFNRGLYDLRPGRAWQERRSFQIFISRTAQEWAGWYDADFWQVMVPQASNTHHCLHHGLVAIGAYHEALQTATINPGRSKALRKFSLDQGQKAASSLVRDRAMLSARVELSTYVVLAALSAFFHPRASIQSLLLQHDFKDYVDWVRLNSPTNLQPSDWHFISQYLEPSLGRQRSKHAQIIDPQWALREAPSLDFQCHDPVHIPERFSTLSHARTILEEILRSKTFHAKKSMLSFDAESVYGDQAMGAWSRRLDSFTNSHNLSGNDRMSAKILQVSAKIISILIATMNTDDEMVFDRFTSEYQELADVFCEANMLDDHSSFTRTNFGIENSFAGFCAAVAMRWCRSPDIRRNFIRSFRATHRQEGLDGAWIWADIFELTQAIEENGIEPSPRSCHDIPSENRRRITRLSLHAVHGLVQVRYLRYPFRPIDIEDYFIPHSGFRTILHSPPTVYDPTSQPELVYGQGFALFARPGRPGEYWTVKKPRFYFNMPRV